MRYAYLENELPEVIEIENIDCSECWVSSHDTDALPDHMVVTMYRAGWSALPQEKKWISEITGEYLLDGTEKTYTAAKVNYRYVAMKMLTQGYCDSSDFSNIEWD